jgi:2-dehydro-3-deoxyphosphogluconate aldolase/(4S)-4-hydroxy-2-oxoglutarate aldolase
MKAPVVPVLVIDSVETALPLARALVAGGLPLLEITLRTDAALDVIEAIAGEVEGAVVGAGTVLTPEQLAAVERRGARFAVSPGATEVLLDAAQAGAVPLLPGAATASEVMRLLERGYREMKFFPAEPAGGVAYLKALASPLPEARFCPTGGIDAGRAKEYLALPSVICVGGSWVAPTDALRSGDWARITNLARDAAALRRAPAEA